MNGNEIKSNWTEIKEKIKSKWTKFNDNEIEAVKENLDSISDKIQSVYGYAKDRADQEFKEFKSTISAAFSEKDAPKTETLDVTKANKVTEKNL